MHLWSHIQDDLIELFIICRELLILLVRSVVCCFKVMISSDWVRDIDQELPMAETLRAAHKLLAVLLESPYTWFLSGPPDDIASIHKFGSKSRWVKGSSPYLSSNRPVHVSWKLEKKLSYSIQENNNLWNKMLNEHTTKCSAQLSMNCCTPLWWSSLRTWVSINSSIGLGSRPKDIACKKKKCCKLNIFINNNKLINDTFH